MVEFALSQGAPMVAMLLLWFVSTGLIAWAGNRDRKTYPRSLAWAGVAAVAGLALIAFTVHLNTPLAAYLSVIGAVAIWGWHELSFLTGAVAGPRREPCPANLRGWKRFRAATACVIEHEVALAATAVLLLALSWGSVNPSGAFAFALLFVLRVSSKLNLFLGVADFSDAMLPRHLTYLKSYFGVRRLHPALLISIFATSALALWLAARAVALPGGTAAATGGMLIAGLAALGALEHLFLALPLNDGALWRWAVSARPHTRESLGRP